MSGKDGSIKIRVDNKHILQGTETTEVFDFTQEEFSNILVDLEDVLRRSFRVDFRNNAQNLILEFWTRKASDNLSGNISTDILIIIFLLFLLLVFNNREYVILIATSNNGNVLNLLSVMHHRYRGMNRVSSHVMIRRNLLGSLDTTANNVLGLVDSREVGVIIHHTIVGLLVRLGMVASIGVVRRHHVHTRSITEHASIVSIHVESISNEVIATIHNIIVVTH